MRNYVHRTAVHNTVLYTAVARNSRRYVYSVLLHSHCNTHPTRRHSHTRRARNTNTHAHARTCTIKICCYNLLHSTALIIVRVCLLGDTTSSAFRCRCRSVYFIFFPFRLFFRFLCYGPRYVIVRYHDHRRLTKVKTKKRRIIIYSLAAYPVSTVVIKVSSRVFYFLLLIVFFNAITVTET